MQLMTEEQKDSVIQQAIFEMLEEPATFSNGGYTIVYQPMSYEGENGRVLAHLLEIDQEDGTMRTSLYYSRAWAYWNFIDATDEADFEIANAAMDYERKGYADGWIDTTIESSEEALAVIKSNSIPHGNAYWQGLVVRLAYNAITNADEFANMVKSGNFTQAEVQRMIDLAVGAVLSSNQFTLTGFDTIAA
jgi:hypothetical protein